jgi:hypothetical protein
MCGMPEIRYHDTEGVALLLRIPARRDAGFPTVRSADAMPAAAQSCRSARLLELCRQRRLYQVRTVVAGPKVMLHF